MGKRILIVDDEPDTRTFLQVLFSENGYETTTASSGDEAYALVSSSKPDLITLDIIMPNQTGVNFYRRLHKEPAFSSIPVVILSGVTRYKELFGRDHATMPKPAAFVEKPIDKDLLLSTISNVLQ